MTHKPRKIIPIAVAPTPQYAPRRTIHPRAIDGFYARWRWALVWLTQIFFYGLPWLQWGGRQMVLFDLEAKRFYLFGLVLYPQDFIYLTGLLIVSALSLFLFTAVAGRLWCGFACPQTVYTEIFLWLERRIEGERSARLRLDKSGWTLEKLGKKSAKHGAWIAVALWTGFTFVGYFIPIRVLGAEVLALQGPWQIFWVLCYALATYGNAGFLREMVCQHMCPYARFQSAMFDPDTLIVSYDSARGEPRGARSKESAATTATATAQGDCIDCSLCVQVCPVGIDIRAGLQYECIGCGLCVDACDSVMDKIKQPRGLIRYATPNGLAGGWSAARMLRRVARSRVLIYGAILLLLSLGMVVSMALRVPLRVNVVLDRAAQGRLAAGGQIENLYRLQLMNATEAAQSLRIRAQGLPGLHLAPGDEADTVLAPTEARWVSVRLRIAHGSAAPGSHPIRFEITSVDDTALRVEEKAAFLVPR
ncbi:cytochrome c oxidase accessory protein CcoG [Acidovorax sp. HDW3]|uniref:cytochrome c oxidase accessory protein CcoG n=1 Tax=Acidovorax sp. HDW3 TaxID=2714923 RepID=UPI00140D04C8|nr:cytochrome c oxidase accessory protein CcoG [Acidovorax sp. HDW3]QIL45149.1 cytochrome c oxidase accessory protein CcoG [Acidovorax sp. HDW3]